MKIRTITFLLFLLSAGSLFAQEDTSTTKKADHWFDKINIRGYAQARYNRLLETNPDLECEQCDNSWGNNGGFFLRRIRIIFFGQISKRVYFYIQPDFASSAGSDRLHFAQIRDAYFDIGLDNDNEFRFRIGQSKIPFGFENMQSSQNRLPLDRNDALNSALRNERDLGVMFYWAPKSKRQLFSSLVRDGLKGSGDYGIFGLGAYNGQTANSPEANNELHYVTRLTWPFELGNQIIEPSIQAYTGKYVLTSVSSGVGVTADKNYLDQRVAGSLVIYPKPFGLQTEYNVGKGPEFNKATDSIEVQSLKGGYVQVSYNAPLSKGKLLPFVRYQQYDGGKKHERDARSYNVRELEVGVEWEPVRQFELVVMYTMSRRRFEDFQNQDNLQKGRLLRLQAQINF